METTKHNAVMKSAEKPKSKKFLILVGLMLGASIILIVAYVLLEFKNNNYQQRNQAIIKEIDSFNKPQATCQQVIDKLGNKSVDEYSSEAQKKLLVQLMFCYSAAGDTNRALQTGEKLRVIYEKEGNAEALRLLKIDIDSLKESKT